MPLPRVLLGALLAWGLAGCASVGASQPQRLLVQPRAGVTLEQLDEVLAPYGARRVDLIRQINVHIVELPPKAEARAVADALKGNSQIESVEIDRRLPPSPAPDGSAPR